MLHHRASVFCTSTLTLFVCVVSVSQCVLNIINRFEINVVTNDDCVIICVDDLFDYNIYVECFLLLLCSREFMMFVCGVRRSPRFRFCVRYSLRFIYAFTRCKHWSTRTGNEQKKTWSGHMLFRFMIISAADFAHLRWRSSGKKLFSAKVIYHN